MLERVSVVYSLRYSAAASRHSPADSVRSASGWFTGKREWLVIITSHSLFPVNHPDAERTESAGEWREAAAEYLRLYTTETLSNIRDDLHAQAYELQNL